MSSAPVAAAAAAPAQNPLPTGLVPASFAAPPTLASTNLAALAAPAPPPPLASLAARVAAALPLVAQESATATAMLALLVLYVPL